MDIDSNEFDQNKYRTNSRLDGQKSRSQSKQLEMINNNILSYYQQQEGLQDNQNGMIKRIHFNLIVKKLMKSPEQRSVEDVIFLFNQLNNLEFFHNIHCDDSLKQKHKLLKEMKIEQFKSRIGQTIYKEGDYSKKFYVVLRGQVKLIQNIQPDQNNQVAFDRKDFANTQSQSNNEQLKIHIQQQSTILEKQETIKDQQLLMQKEQQVVLKVLNPGQYFGENELIYNSKRYCSAVCSNNTNINQSEDTIVGVFCQNIFKCLIQEFMRKQNPFYQSLSLLQLVPKDGKLKLSYLCKKKILRYNEMIYKQDAKVDFIYYLDKGSIQLKFQQKKILEGLPYSVQQKKEETQLLCTIQEKSFIGDEDLINLNGNRQYSAIVSSTNAVVFYVDSSILINEIQDVYGVQKANQLIGNYLSEKQKWREQFIQAAQQVKKQFDGYSSCSSKLNQNLLQKNQSNSKHDLLGFMANFKNEIVPDNIKKLDSTNQRCKTETSYQTFDEQQLLSASFSDINENFSIHLNQNHLKVKKSKTNNSNIPIPSKLSRAVTCSMQTPLISLQDKQQYETINPQLTQINNEKFNKNTKENFNNTIHQNLDKNDSKQKQNRMKFNTIDYENQLETKNLQKSSQKSNFQNNKFRKCNSIDIDDKLTETHIMTPSLTFKTINKSPSLEQQLYREQQREKSFSREKSLSRSLFSQAFIPKNLSQFNIQNQKNDEVERMPLNEINQFGSNLNINQKSQLCTATTQIMQTPQKIYDPFNDCWVKKTYPMRQMQKAKNKIDILKSFKFKFKDLNSGDTTQNKYQAQTNIPFVSNLNITNNPFGDQFTQIKLDSPNSQKSNRYSPQRDLKFSAIFENNSIRDKETSINCHLGEGQTSLQGLNLVKEYSDYVTSYIVVSPMNKVQTPKLNQSEGEFKQKTNKISIFNQEFQNQANSNSINQNSINICKDRVQKRINSNEDNALKDRGQKGRISYNEDNTQNEVKSFNDLTREQQKFNLKQSSRLDQFKNQKQLKRNKKQRDILSKSFLNSSIQDQQYINQDKKFRNNSSDQYQSRGIVKTEGDVIEDQKNSNCIDNSKKQFQKQEIKQNLLRRLRKSSVEKCKSHNELVHQYLNHFIEENCNGNEIYQLESSNVIEKKQQLLKHLLSQIGTPSLNCIDMNEDQKNTKYDYILRSLERKRQKNQILKGSEEGFYQKNNYQIHYNTIGGSSNKTISRNKNHLTEETKYNTISGSNFNNNKERCNTMSKNRTISTETKESFNEQKGRKTLSMQLKNIDENNKINQLNGSQQNSKIFQNILGTYMKRKIQDPYSSDLQQNSIEDSLNQFNILRQTNTIPSSDLLCSSKEMILGQKKFGNSNNLLKQKLEIKKKLKQQPISRSMNGRNSTNQTLDLQKLHQTLFVYNKNHSTSQMSYHD